MSSKSKNKGTRNENYIKKLHLDLGLPCMRVPLSGSIGGPHFSGDIIVGSIDEPDFRCEVKARKDGKGFAVLEKWIGEHDILFLRKDRTQPFVGMPWRTYEKLIRSYYGKTD